jgi:ATP-dependent Clp protease ATP-binding subunit ClpA
MNVFSKDLELISQKAGQVAAKNWQTWVGTPHLFLATMMFLNNQKDNERYRESHEKLKSLLNASGVDGKKFEEKFYMLFPKGLERTENEKFEIEWEKEGQAVFNNIKAEGLKQKREMQVEDLIRELFSDRSYKLQIIIKEILNDSAPETDKLCESIVEEFKNVNKKQEVEALEKLKELTNLSRMIKEKNPIAIGMDSSVNQIQLGLSGKSISNVILVGQAGTGKTAAVYEFVKRVNNKDVIKSLRNKIVYQLDPGALSAGTRYRGDFEEKLMNIIKAVKANPEVILFIDEAHMMTKLGDAEGAASAGNIFKPFITRGEVQMIWATTTDEYQKHIDKDKALARRFHKVNISEPSKEETHSILVGILPSVEEFFKKKGSKDLVDKVLEFAEKYTLDQANPAKAINMLELAFANSKVFNEDGQIVFTKDVMDSIKLKYDINISDTKSDDTALELKSAILGQEEPLQKIVNNLRFIENGLVDLEKPLLSMIFAGPTGVGKTETAKIMAKKYFGSEKNLIKINMGEYGTEMDVTKITGSAPGYVGHDDESGIVALVKQYPNSVVLFDEIEKAHPKVFDTILNILDTGEMTDNHKNRVSFRNTVIIFTTNLGYTKDFAKEKGLGFVKTKTESKDIKEEVENHFRPEFINRIDDIIVFNGLDETIAEVLINRYVKEYQSNMENKQEVKFTKEDIEEIIKVSEIKTFGARGLKRAVRKQILKFFDRKINEVSGSKKQTAKKKQKLDA